ncbi:hypothetical protein [Streptomyces sp. ISL-10]|uniref:hypothetical protein n=1 Tax=Streptomyces sp. ISL-10 TaxID=2819172 RepID=UPI002035654E|nr:hypothetical protein [Streptomyces sp. ISL-10]
MGSSTTDEPCGISITARPPTCPGAGTAEALSSASCSQAHPLKVPFGGGEFVPLGPRLRQLLGQLFFEFVQFRAPRGDPFQQLGIHARDPRRPPGQGEQEPANRPSPVG